MVSTLHKTHRKLRSMVFILSAAACGSIEPSDNEEALVSSDLIQTSAADGPFASVAALQAYWAAQQNSACINIFENGHKVYSRGGFGPCFEQQYFQCPGSIGIKTHCADMRAGDAVLTNVVATLSAQDTIYLDGTLYRSGTLGNDTITTCKGEAGFFGPIVYYRVTFAFSPFVGQPYQTTCYP
jgi:hypothetical protein